MQNVIIIGLLLVIVFIILMKIRQTAYYDKSPSESVPLPVTLVDEAVQMIKERKPGLEIIAALEAKGMSANDAFAIAKEAEQKARLS